RRAGAPLSKSRMIRPARAEGKLTRAVATLARASIDVAHGDCVAGPAIMRCPRRAFAVTPVARPMAEALQETTDDVLARSAHDLEVRLRRRVERAIEALGSTALRLGVDRLAGLVARPLAVAPDLRPRPVVVVLSGGIRSTGRLNATTAARVRHAVDLMRAGRAET